MNNQKYFPYYQTLSLFSLPICKLLQQSLLLSIDIHQQEKLGRLVKKKKERKKKKTSSPSILQSFQR